MATDQESNCSIGGSEEDYIDMEVSCSSSPSSYSINTSSSPSHHQNREFEFQMTSSVQQNRDETDTNNSPADQLFYKGNLLPLHLPPRLQMVQTLLLQTTTTTTTATNSAAVTPLDSCNISPSDSCRPSSELNPDEYFFQWSTDTCGFLLDHHRRHHQIHSCQSKKSWARKLRQSALCQKLKASRAFLKGFLFNGSQNDDESSKPQKTHKTESSLPPPPVEAAETEVTGAGEKRDCYFGKFPKLGAMKENGGGNPFGRIENYERYQCRDKNTLKRSIEKEMAEEKCFGFSSGNSISISSYNQQRKSFSGAIQCHISSSSSSFSATPTKSSSSSSSTSSSGSSSSSSFSLSSNGMYYDLLWLKRSSSADSKEVENSIEGAIAHCKKSRDDDANKGPAPAAVRETHKIGVR